MSQPKLMFYHDGRHPLIYMYEPPMQKEEYEQGVDELIGTPVDCINFCMGDGRTVLHDTKVGELWGHANDKWSHAIFRGAHQNAKEDHNSDSTISTSISEPQVMWIQTSRDSKTLTSSIRK